MRLSIPEKNLLKKPATETAEMLFDGLCGDPADSLCSTQYIDPERPTEEEASHMTMALLFLTTKLIAHLLKLTGGNIREEFAKALILCIGKCCDVRRLYERQGKEVPSGEEEPAP